MLGMDSYGFSACNVEDSVGGGMDALLTILHRI